MDEKWTKAYGMALGALIGSVLGALITAGLAAAGEWSFYSHEYAYAGVKFAPSHVAGCGFEIRTAAGRELTDGPLYCE